MVQSDTATEPYAKAAGCIIEYVGKLACMAGLDEGLLSLCLPIIVYT